MTEDERNEDEHQMRMLVENNKFKMSNKACDCF